MMSRYGALEKELYGDEQDPTEVPSRAISPTSDDPGVSPDFESGEPAEDPMSVADSPVAATAPQAQKPQGEKWSPDFLGAIAVLTRNPALMQQLQAREQDKREQKRIESGKPMADLALRGKTAEVEGNEARVRLTQAMRDVKSPQSMSAQKEFADYAMASAEMPGLPPEFVARFKKAAENAGNMSAEQISSARPVMDKMLGNVVKAKGADASSRLAAESMGLRREGLDAQRENAAAMRSLAGARFAETHEENQRRQDDREKNRDEKEAEAYGKDISPLNEQDALLTQVKALKGENPDKPLVNTGKVANFLQGIRQKIGLEDHKWDTAEGLLAGVNNQIIKLQAGGNVTSGEAIRMQQQLPDMSKDDAEFNDKLATVMQQIALKQQQVKAKHPRTSGVVASSPADPKVTRAREILSDPKETPEKKAKAQKWLDAHNK